MSIYKRFIRPSLFRCDPEGIHNKVIRGLHVLGEIAPLRGCIRKVMTVKDRRLEQKLFGITFPNPVGLAAGMDKDGCALPGFEALGFGFIEMGCVTALPQEGNQKPRVFRLVDDEAIINRMGFNGIGAEAVRHNLESVRLHIPLGANIGKSKVVPIERMDEVITDYCFTLRLLHPVVDFFVINVSSPNTPGLRGLQGPEFLKVLLKGIQFQNSKMSCRPGERQKPILVKVAPDLSWEELDGILSVIEELGIDGIVATNTTTKRDGLKTTGSVVEETGGLSGKPLFLLSLEVVAYIHKRMPTLPIIGVGGIFSTADALKMIEAGARLVQIYTGFVYEGPGLPRKINRRLLGNMKDCGIKSIL